MTPIALLTTVALSQATANAPDPHRLPIGRPGEVQAQRGLTDLRTGRPAVLADVVRSADGLRFVLVGESHTSPEHHQLQAQIIDALAQAGRSVVVGFEMFTRPNQENLAPWSAGLWTEEQFVQRADWKSQWGFDFSIYRPIFEAVRKHRLPMVALNVPRDWVRAVGRGGPGALTEEQKSQLPPLYLQNRQHRTIFEAMLGGHPVTGAAGENMYAAQVLWDEGMADTALKYFESKPGTSNSVMVIVAGSGHVMYGQGISWRIARRTGEKSLIVVAIDGTAPRTVAKGLADFVFLSDPPR